jgi:isoquinoline 1-oxidoreductase beta subunit
MNSSTTGRRDFLKLISVAGAGLAFGIYDRHEYALAEESGMTLAPSAYLAIDPSGSVKVMVARAEMGQGVRTSIPMLVAEELEADWSKVQIEQALADPKYGDMVTGGSMSMRVSWKPLRSAGAAAREMLLSAAAKEWNVERSTCYADKGSIVHRPSGRRIEYGKLVNEAARLPIPENPPLKDPKDYRIIGTRVRRLDTPDKLRGTALFGIDTAIPGMLVAAVLRCPVLGGSVKSYDSSKALTTPGVRRVVQVPSGIAVLADTTWAAFQGRDNLTVEWNEGPNATLSSESIRRMFEEKSKTKAGVARTEGDIETSLKSAKQTIEATYELPFLAHATLEPMNCIAHTRADSIDIWTPSQSPLVARDAVAGVMGLPPEKVTVHPTLVGGGFGRRTWPDTAIESAQVSKAAGVPVKVVWTREEDMRHDLYRPASLHRLGAGIDANGKLNAWHHRVVAPSIIGQLFPQNGDPSQPPDIVDGAAQLPYATPSILVDYVVANTPVPVLWWRSVYHSQHAFVNESFIDEIAALAGKDPYEYRRSMLPDDSRIRGVLELAAEKAGWGKALPAGRGRGIACHKSFNTYVAQVAEVTVREGGAIRVDRVVCAVDCGLVINPDTVEAQMESGIVLGLTAALFGEITIKDGRIQQGNFDDYQLLRYDEVPAIEVHIVKSGADPTGVGEPGLPPLAPAVCNAIYAATGKRIRRLPIRLQ